MGDIVRLSQNPPKQQRRFYTWWDLLFFTYKNGVCAGKCYVDLIFARVTGEKGASAEKMPL